MLQFRGNFEALNNNKGAKLQLVLHSFQNLYIIIESVFSSYNEIQSFNDCRFSLN